jgi:tetratricopeptide (TPR) repeat protein
LKNNAKDENFGMMSSWFTAQSGILRNKAANSLRGLYDVTTMDYLMVGYAMQNAGQPNRAADLYKKAIEVLQPEGDPSFRNKIALWFNTAMNRIKFETKKPPQDDADIVELSSIYSSWGASLYQANMPLEAEQKYNQAISAYNKVNWKTENLNTQIAFVHKFWAEALAKMGNCGAARAHFETAYDLFHPQRKNAQDVDWNSIQYGLNWARACEAGKVQPAPASPGQAPRPAATPMLSK